MTARSIAVVGGGISGLAAAWELTRQAPEIEVTVFEASDRLGGKLRSEEFLGHRVDAGADAFLVRTPDALDLCHELGLEDELVHPASRSALLWVDGALRRLPEGLVLGVPTDLDALADSGILSPAGLERVRADLAEPGPTAASSPQQLPVSTEPDTTVGAVVRSHLGDEAFEKLVSPLLSGVNAGDADELSIEAGAPQLAAAARHGSLIRGAQAQRAQSGGDPDAPIFASLRGGTGRLAEALADQLRDRGVSLVVGDAGRVSTTNRSDPGWVVHAGAGTRAVDGVVLALPAHESARLLPDESPLHPDLVALDYSSVAVAILGYQRGDVAHGLDASGVLVAAGEGLLMTACSFGSTKWPQWTDDDVALFRVSAGRHHDQRFAALTDAELVAALHAELAPMLGIDGEPIDARVMRWERALPQYRPGHLDRVDRWDQDLARTAPGLVLAGASTRGLGIPACIRSGRSAAARLLSAVS